MSCEGGQYPYEQYNNLYKEQNRIFQEMAPLKLFLRCALPNMISMAVVSLYTIADGVFVGHYIGAEAWLLSILSCL